jgi:hypothetical protein
LVHGLCEICTAVVRNTGTLTDKAELHIAKHLKPHTEFWVLPTANAELQRCAEADVLTTVPRCPSTSRIGSKATVEHTRVCRILHHDGSYPEHIHRGQHIVPCMVLSAAITTVQSVSHILFTDKAHFTRNGITNTRNSDYCAQEIHKRYHNVTCDRDFESTCGVEYQTVIWLDRILSRDA